MLKVLAVVCLQFIVTAGLPSEYEFKIVQQHVKSHHLSDMQIDNGQLIYCDRKLRHCELIDSFKVENIDFDCHTRFFGVNFELML